MSENETDREESAIRVQLDPPPPSNPSESTRRNRVRPTLTTVPSGIIVHDFQEAADQQEVLPVIKL